jgi:hypothetical protein
MAASWKSSSVFVGFPRPFCCIVSDPALWSACVRLHRSLRASGRRATCRPSLRVKVRCGWCGTTRSSEWQQARRATSRIRWVQREQTQLLRPTCLELAGLHCVVYACKTFLRVRNGDPWLDVANRQGVLGGSWTRLGSEARWTSQMPCRCVAIGSKGASEALLLLSGGKPGRRGRCDLDTRPTRAFT